MRDKKMRTLILAAVVGVFALGLSAPAGAVELKASDTVFVNLNALMQPTIQFTNSATGGPDLGTDFYLRRMRILFGGQVSDLVSFFFETEQANWGKGANWGAGEFFIQDAFVSFNIHEAFIIDIGMILPPFMHQFRQSAVSLSTLDYHAALAKFPAGSQQVWRDAGIEFRGIVAKKLDYRLSITNGVVGGDDDIPRFTGRIAWNFFDAEPTFFYGGTYLGKKTVLAVGVNFDVQPDAVALTAGGTKGTYFGIGGDVFFDMPFKGGNRLSGQLGFIYYGGSENPDKGMGMLFDIGYAIGQWQPTIAVDWFQWDGKSDLKDQHLGFHVGLTYWLQGHAANIKLNLGMVKTGVRSDPKALAPTSVDFGDTDRQLTVQTQLFF